MQIGKSNGCNGSGSLCGRYIKFIAWNKCCIVGHAPAAPFTRNTMTRLSSSKKSKSRITFRASFSIPFPLHWSKATPTVTVGLGIAGSYTSRSMQTYESQMHVFSASRKSERSLRSVPPPPKAYAAMYCAQGVEPYITLNFVITSFNPQNVLA